MKRYVQFEPLKIEDFERETWNHPTHQHNHFEIIYIMHGRGSHTINKHKMSYQSGNLFLLRPDDHHRFNITTKTRFIYFKFTKLYFTIHQDLHIPKHWKREIDLLLMQSQIKNGRLIDGGSDSELTRQLMEMISNENSRPPKRSRKVIFQLFSVILTLIKCNKTYPLVKLDSKDTSKISSILDYIDRHIHHPKKLSAQDLAEEFYLSPNYIGSYFKNHMGVTLSKYISKYRLELIKLRLKYSSESMKEIAAEFGFFDTSHFTRFFKKHTGCKPSDFRIKKR